MKQINSHSSSSTTTVQHSATGAISSPNSKNSIGLITGFCLGLMLLMATKAEAQNWPWISSAYISYSTYWFKNVTTAPDGSRSISTTYSTGSKSTSSGSSYSRTRTNTNGIVSVMNGFWIQTDDNYYATTSFQSPGPNGSTYTSAERHTAEFAADYSNPSQSGAYIDVEIWADLSYVSSTGTTSGSTRSRNLQTNIQPGNSGRITLSPSSSTQTNSYDAEGMYFMIN